MMRDWALEGVGQTSRCVGAACVSLLHVYELVGHTTKPTSGAIIPSSAALLTPTVSADVI